LPNHGSPEPAYVQPELCRASNATVMSLYMHAPTFDTKNKRL